MHQFTAQEFRLLLDDLFLYCGDGNVREITDTYGPTPHGGGYCGGVIHTCMDSFKFMTAGLHDQKECWAIDLPMPAECMTLGHRRIRPFYGQQTGLSLARPPFTRHYLPGSLPDSPPTKDRKTQQISGF